MTFNTQAAGEAKLLTPAKIAKRQQPSYWRRYNVDTYYIVIHSHVKGGLIVSLNSTFALVKTSRHCWEVEI